MRAGKLPNGLRFLWGARSGTVQGAVATWLECDQLAIVRRTVPIFELANHRRGFFCDGDYDGVGMSVGLGGKD